METRRLLSLVELLDVFLGPSRLKKARRLLKRHLEAFNSLRDTQVQLLLLAKHPRQFPEVNALRHMLAKREDRCRQAAARHLEGVKTRPLQKAIHRLARRLARVNGNATQLARRRDAVMKAVGDAFAKTVKLRRAMDPASVETIHRTRLAFKKFRYMVEALQPLLAAVTPERVAAMQDFQSMMGEVQDTEVFLTRLDKYTRGHASRAQTLAPFRRWLLERHTAQILYCLEHADCLLNFWPLQKKPTGRPAALESSRRPSPSR